MFEEWLDARTGLTVWVSAGSGETRVLPDLASDVMLWRGAIFLAGFDTAAQHFDRRAGSTTIGVRLPPGTLASLAGDSASLMLNQRRELGPAPEELILSAQHKPVFAATYLAAWTRLRLASLTPDKHGRLAAQTVLRRALAGERIDLMARQLGWSPRKLQRFTVEQFGMPPVQLRSIARFHKASALVAAGAPLADAAAKAGYSDQAHFTRAVHQIADTTPRLLHNAHRVATASRVD
ncbi:helix-turn-helix domain-containing protein [Microbacterium sp. NPDC089698]|uniref:helix-turn-helix domain-containing protein n=1 Tax=Microbacterium sp. NPDC089698 TaxID=3364200 RepID=UPI00381C7DBD